uniref:Uncharacterized protein n=1 Tax=uncultured Armatimonadetes bacterium TaxID=157466 RepID=A0A6J4INI3_9BACT|nr:hypothetical protein AVDCRST_MAG63-2230 [uncultured Armatimonadetes bacterium]
MAYRLNVIKAAFVERRLRLLFLIALFLIGSVVAAFATRVPRLHGTDTWQTVAHAERVVVHRLDPGRFFKNRFRLEGSTVGMPVVPGPRWRRRLQSALAAPWHYPPDMRKRCAVRPGVSVRFYRDRRVAEALFCFECSMLSIAAPEGRRRWVDFDPMRPRLVNLIQEVFPQDPDIQALR